jgi:hypothetical protein
VASHAAQGWGGDLFLFESRPAERSLTLVTAWDTERDAIEFQKAVSYTGECLDAEESSSSKPRIRGETKSRRRGNAVVVVRGTDGDYDALFALVRRSSPARPPFGPLTARVIRARPRQDFRPDEVKGNLIVSERLGFSIPAPKEYTPKLGQGIRLIRKERPQEALVVYGVPAFYGPASLKRLLDAVSKGAGERFQQVRSTDAWLTTALGRGFQRSWRRKAPAQSLTVTIIPTCKKKALLFVIQTYESAAGKKALDRLVTEIRRLETVAPLCASVEP